MICIHPGCDKETGSGLRKRCEPHRIEAEQATTDRSNAKRKAQLAAYRANNPYRCITSCGTVVEQKNMLCASCKAKKQKVHRIHRAKKAATVADNAEYIKPDVPKPHKYTKIVLTAEENDRQCKKAERELAKRRETLDPFLLAARNCKGSILMPSAVTL